MTNLPSLIEKFDAFLLDAYGVFWGSSATGMLPQAKETMAKIVSLGKIVGILSNTTQLALVEKEKFAKYGVLEGVHYHFILTSGEVTKALLSSTKLPFETPKKTYILFTPDHPEYSSHLAIFNGTEYKEVSSIEEADFIYVPIPHINGKDQEKPEDFLEMVQKAAKKNLPVLCANPDLFAHEGAPPRLVVRQGSIAHLFIAEKASVHFIGKPYPIVYEQALAKFPKKFTPKDILMVGDTPETDIRGAKSIGMKTALVTKTGVMKERIKDQDIELVVEDLPLTDKPDFIVTHFGLYDF